MSLDMSHGLTDEEKEGRLEIGKWGHLIIDKELDYEDELEICAFAKDREAIYDWIDAEGAIKIIVTLLKFLDWSVNHDALL